MEVSMEKIIINKLGPIEHCELNIKDFMVFTGPQASGKSTIAKSIFFFKNLKNLLFMQLNRKLYGDTETVEITTKNRFIKEIRSNFLQTFGTTWCMDQRMFLKYYYTDEVYIKISLRSDPTSYNYIWIDLSDNLADYLAKYDDKSIDNLTYDRNHDVIKKDLDELFNDDSEVIYIPAGRSMMTLLSSQLMFLYSVMNDEQKRSLDYCTQNYLERILRLKPFFSNSIIGLIKEKISTSEDKVDKRNLLLCAELMREILHGEYRNIDGEERLQVAEDRYVKINFASSGQQEAIWILNVLFYYLLNNRKAYFIIEEPESHLFPNAQKLITEFISLCKNGGNRILLTTHSPYILGTINNLLYANRISENVDKMDLNQIIDSNKWIDFKKLDAYFIENGVVESCLDEEIKEIDNAVIDGASDTINEDYDKMVDLKFSQKMEVE